MTVIVVNPIQVTQAMFISSSLIENDYPVYSISTTYAFGDRVIANHRIYESAKAGNANKDPTLLVNRSGSTIWWLDVGATNQWAMLDTTSTQPTQVTSTSMQIKLRPGAIDTLYLSGIVAERVRVELKYDNTVQNSPTLYQLEENYPGDYYDYFYLPFRQKKELLITNLPPFVAGEITITFERTVLGALACGAACFGLKNIIGELQWGSTSELKTWSATQTKNGYKQFSVFKQSRDLKLPVFVESNDASDAMRVIAQYLDKPALWFADVPGVADADQYRCFGTATARLNQSSVNGRTIDVSVTGT